MSPAVLIIGCGSIGERHLRCFQKTGRCEVSACESNEGLLRRIGEQYGVATFSSLDAALAAKRPDALVICTPAPTHLSIARRGAEQGAALFIEKPLAVTMDEIEVTRAAIAR